MTETEVQALIEGLPGARLFVAVGITGYDIANHWNEWAGGTQAEMNGVCEYGMCESAPDDGC